ncbi:MAG: HisA/HisF-related TIM barrel protein, partial [Archaeoglobaceae archaeon]
ERSKYRAVAEKSLIVDTSEPIGVLEKIKPRFLYTADLDRILGKGNNLPLLNSISFRVEEMIADCGFRNAYELKDLHFVPVLGTETFDITKLSEIDRKCYVSLDFHGERFLDSSQKFEKLENALEFLNSFRLRGVIVLNLKRVGSGTPDLDLFLKVLKLSENPVYLGGGVGKLEDLENLKNLGCSGVLVSSAVHKKTIPLKIIRNGII